jgi:hypothetical protein
MKKQKDFQYNFVSNVQLVIGHTSLIHHKHLVCLIEIPEDQNLEKLTLELSWLLEKFDKVTKQ